MNSLMLRFALLVALLFPWVSRAEEKAHDCLVVVFDGSGSMSYGMEGKNSGGPQRIDIAKSALKAALAKVPKDTWIGVVVFSTAMRGNEWIIPLGPRVSDMDARIDAIRVDGGTPLGAYIELAGWTLIQERKKQFDDGRYRLLVITDGVADDEPLMLNVASDAVERGIELVVIPLGTMNKDHKLAKMANQFLPAASAGELETALSTAVSVETSGNGQAASEDFALVAGLPDDAALAWISAVTAPKGNWRYGHKPEPTAPAPVAGSNAAAPTVARGPSDPQPPSGGCSAVGPGAASVLGTLLALAAIGRRRSLT